MNILLTTTTAYYSDKETEELNGIKYIWVEDNSDDVYLELEFGEVIAIPKSIIKKIEITTF